jgi:hypothetical protein
MVYRWATSALGLLTCVLVATRASGQVADQRAESNRRRGVLGQNQPNPFSQETTIPFTVGDADCAAGTQRHVVTIRIYNILSQVVAIPMLVDSAVTDPPGTSAATHALLGVSLPCGSYGARWDGRHAHNNREAAPGVYMYQLIVDGHPQGTRKMLLKR